MIKKILVLLLIINGVLCFAKKNISFSAGFNVTEEFFTVLYQTQYSPKFNLRFEIEKKFRYFYLEHKLNLDFSLWNIYYKNNLLYYTDKTLSLDLPFDYEFSLNLTPIKQLNIIFGSGWALNLRFDRYSKGNFFWHSTLKFSPHPFLSIGIGFNLFSRLDFFIKDSIGFFYSYFFSYSKESYITSTYCTLVTNRFIVESSIKIVGRYRIYFGYTNRIEVFLDPSIFMPFLGYTTNFFYLGLKIEI